MRQKKAKQLRRKAYELMVGIIRDLTKDFPEAEEMSDHELLAIGGIPDGYINRGRTKLLSIYSWRWICQQVKKDPDVTVEDLIARGKRS